MKQRESGGGPDLRAPRASSASAGRGPFETRARGIIPFAPRRRACAYRDMYLLSYLCISAYMDGLGLWSLVRSIDRVEAAEDASCLMPRLMDGIRELRPKATTKQQTLLGEPVVVSHAAACTHMHTHTCTPSIFFLIHCGVPSFFFSFCGRASRVSAAAAAASTAASLCLWPPVALLHGTNRLDDPGGPTRQDIHTHTHS